jgi:hypothetical protein
MLVVWVTMIVLGYVIKVDQVNIGKVFSHIRVQLIMVYMLDFTITKKLQHMLYFEEFLDGAEEKTK